MEKNHEETLNKMLASLMNTIEALERADSQYSPASVIDLIKDIVETAKETQY